MPFHLAFPRKKKNKEGFLSVHSASTDRGICVAFGQTGAKVAAGEDFGERTEGDTKAKKSGYMKKAGLKERKSDQTEKVRKSAAQ